MGCSVCPFPDIVRRPWTVFRDFVREAASELADVPRVDGANLLSLSQEHCETMLSVGPVVAYPFALASLTEAASFIQYVQTPQDVGKKACFASLSSEQKGDFVPTDIQSFLQSQKAWHDQLQTCWLGTVLSGLQHAESQPVQVHHLDETSRDLVRCLLEHIPTCFQGSGEGIRAALKREPEALVKLERKRPRQPAGSLRGDLLPGYRSQHLEAFSRLGMLPAKVRHTNALGILAAIHGSCRKETVGQCLARALLHPYWKHG